MVNNLFLAADDLHWSLVCLIGIAVVFVGLACIIGLVELMNWATNKAQCKVKSKGGDGEVSAPVVSPAVSTAIENRDEIVAAVCAAVAEENGTDISAIRVVSFKKV